MSDFYVVSKVTPDAKDYAASVVFNNTTENYDNEGAANEYANELSLSQPWRTHVVMNASDYDAFTNPDHAPAAPVNSGIPVT